ncbi:MAG: acyl carrier protein [Anaerovibrio sp.]|uniref:acyl carrier protein n=1 Tax=Anaerovibrio sp. TaxID=1872532 RepID=UPI0025C4D93F|nr:acyl carrier protein [Anaerovibrio sp.]MBE6099347.1 acyl carrier protein [Anaerovibrio sp.]
MTNMEKYKEAFKEALEIDDNALTDDLAFDSIPEWDSVGHMRLMASIEDAFDIMFETEDIMDFGTFGKGKEILQKYDVEL